MHGQITLPTTYIHTYIHIQPCDGVKCDESRCKARKTTHIHKLERPKQKAGKTKDTHTHTHKGGKDDKRRERRMKGGKNEGKHCAPGHGGGAREDAVLEYGIPYHGYCGMLCWSRLESRQVHPWAAHAPLPHPKRHATLRSWSVTRLSYSPSLSLFPRSLPPSVSERRRCVCVCRRCKREGGSNGERHGRERGEGREGEGGSGAKIDIMRAYS